MCRVCLDENNLQVISLTTLYDTRSVGEMIHYCTGVEVFIIFLAILSQNLNYKSFLDIYL